MDIEKLQIALSNAGYVNARDMFRDAGIKFKIGEDVNEKVIQVFRVIESTLELYRHKGVDGISGMKGKILVGILRECNAKQGNNLLEHTFNIVKLCNCLLVFVEQHYRECSLSRNE